MSQERVKKYFQEQGLLDRIREYEKSSATVELAAEAIGCQPKEIAKTLAVHLPDRVAVVVAAGDAKLDNKKFKETFRVKAKMVAFDAVEDAVGYPAGGVCPFVLKEGVDVYLDESLRRFHRVYPAAGSAHSAIDLTVEELEEHSRARGWVDVCKDWERKETK